ncbi:unnamed protein product [Closterium sp. NIES-53]
MVNISAGTELATSYGLNTNDQLLATYGLVLHVPTPLTGRPSFTTSNPLFVLSLPHFVSLYLPSSFLPASPIPHTLQTTHQFEYIAMLNVSAVTELATLYGPKTNDQLLSIHGFVLDPILTHYPLSPSLPPFPLLQITHQFEYIAMVNVSAGTELATSYGPKTNDQLLATYGFVLDSNPFDGAPLFENLTEAVGVVAALLANGGGGRGGRGGRGEGSGKEGEGDGSVVAGVLASEGARELEEIGGEEERKRRREVYPGEVELKRALEEIWLTEEPPAAQAADGADSSSSGGRGSDGSSSDGSSSDGSSSDGSSSDGSSSDGSSSGGSSSRGEASTSSGSNGGDSTNSSGGNDGSSSSSRSSSTPHVPTPSKWTPSGASGKALYRDLLRVAAKAVAAVVAEGEDGNYTDVLKMPQYNLKQRVNEDAWKRVGRRKGERRRTVASGGSVGGGASGVAGSDGGRGGDGVEGESGDDGEEEEEGEGRKKDEKERMGEEQEVAVWAYGVVEPTLLASLAAVWHLVHYEQGVCVCGRKGF